jgi:hypothetical protein
MCTHLNLLNEKLINYITNDYINKYFTFYAFYKYVA